MVLVCSLLAACKTLPGPREFTPDGLERMPSRANGGVFRAPGAPFTQYQRLIVEPLTVAFVKDWENRHEDVSPKELKRMRDEAARDFRKEFVDVLIDEGPYAFADEPAPDVLMISPSVVDLDIPAPEVDSDMRSLTPRSVSLRVVGDLRDAATGKLVGRIDMFSGGQPYGAGSGQLRPANRGTNAHEMRQAYAEWAQLLRETLDVAKVERPHPPPQPQQRLPDATPGYFGGSTSNPLARSCAR
jgi:hypothetical protein